MSKMSDIHEAIEELRIVAASINVKADWLYQQFSGDEAPAQETPTKAELEPEIKLEDARAALAEKSRAGHTAEVSGLF